MKTVKTIALEFPNGDLLLGCNGTGAHRTFFIKTQDGISVYNEDEVDEIYNGLVPADSHLVGKKA